VPGTRTLMSMVPSERGEARPASDSSRTARDARAKTAFRSPVAGPDKPPRPISARPSPDEQVPANASTPLTDLLRQNRPIPARPSPDEQVPANASTPLTDLLRQIGAIPTPIRDDAVAGQEADLLSGQRPSAPEAQLKVRDEQGPARESTGPTDGPMSNAGTLSFHGARDADFSKSATPPVGQQETANAGTQLPDNLDGNADNGPKMPGGGSDPPGGGGMGPEVPPRREDTGGDDIPVFSGNDWKWSDSNWESLRDLPENVRGAKPFSDLGAVYTKVRIRFKAARGKQAAIVRVEAFNVLTGRWERVELRPEHRQSLAEIGIRVVTEEAESAVAKWLPAPTQLDKLDELAKLLLAPKETLVPKFLGILAEGVARHAGMPGFVAKWIGAFVEQAVSPLFEPGGTRGTLLACMEDFAVTCDIGSGQMTSTVVNIALDRLADELKRRTESAAA
jgi:hypothetical protein